MVRLSRELYKIDIENQLDDIRSYLGNHPNVAAAFLFGSYGTEFQNYLSDVDVAILLFPGTEIDLDLVGDLYGNLAEIASEEDINVVILNTVPITLQFEVLATGRLLCKKELYLEDFHEYVCKHYADFKIDLDAFNSDYDKALREVYLHGRQRCIYMVDNNRLRDKLQSIQTNLAELKKVEQLSLEEFVNSVIQFHATTRMLQISIEAILDIAQHVVARKHLGTPKTYREAIELLAKAGILSADQLPTLLNMVRFRNRVVHQYDDVSRAEVYRIATERLTDFEHFIAAIVRYNWGA